MRLLHTQKLVFREFYDTQIPPYAILSHRWEEDEVTLQDWRSNIIKDGAGYRKIVKSCAMAASQKLEWIWVDTCCM